VVRAVNKFGLKLVVSGKGTVSYSNSNSCFRQDVLRFPRTVVAGVGLYPHCPAVQVNCSLTYMKYNGDVLRIDCNCIPFSRDPWYFFSRLKGLLFFFGGGGGGKKALCFIVQKVL
jgi:hypothetical protein